jgi:hypothetical protein
MRRSVIIRSITENDEKLMADFWIKLKSTAPYFQTSEMIKIFDFARSMVKGRKEGNAYCLVAVDDGKIIGFCNQTFE